MTKILTTSDSEVIDKLEAAIEAETLSHKDIGFALSLTRQFRQGMNRGKRKPLSEKQCEWVYILLERAEGSSVTGSMTPKKAEHDVIELGDMANIFEKFNKALANDILHPKIRFMVDDKQLSMYLNKDHTRINVGAKGDFGQNQWFGSFDSAGQFQMSRRYKLPDGTDQVLREFASNPSAAGRAIGLRMKWCCFCARPLTTTDSLYYGYGPVCAEKWELEWGNARARLKNESLDAIGDFIAQETKGVA